MPPGVPETSPATKAIENATINAVSWMSVPLGNKIYSATAAQPTSNATNKTILAMARLVGKYLGNFDVKDGATNKAPPMTNVSAAIKGGTKVCPGTAKLRRLVKTAQPIRNDPVTAAEMRNAENNEMSFNMRHRTKEAVSAPKPAN